MIKFDITLGPACFLKARYGMIDILKNKDEKKLIHAVSNDPKAGIKAAGLVYVSDALPGFSRKRRGKTFIYLDENGPVRNEEQLNRIKGLVLPPAWQKVWVCKLPNGHLQATGIDKLGRKQYKYHSYWMEIRNKAKFYRLKNFGEKLPLIRSNLRKDLSLPGFPQNKVLAAMVSLLERINIRIGNSSYEKLYGSFGLTTLKNHHVRINGNTLRLMFRGKKGIVHNISFSSKKLSKIILGCREIPGKELFEYYDEEGNVRVVDSGMVNNYIKTISGSDFTAKDFRTWAGTLHSLLAFKEVGDFETLSEMNKKIPAALDIVAKQLGNTRAVCKKYYVHPVIIELYQDRKLNKFLSELNESELNEREYGKNEPDLYVGEERLLLKILDNSLKA